MSICYLSLGSNEGDRELLLRTAVDKLGEETGIQIRQCSSLYETEPIGYTEQAPFLNAVVEIETSLPPERLLEICMQIEQELGRERTIRWGPRTIDIDILLFADLHIDMPKLVVPHPRLHERLFVLKPLAELNPLLVWDGESILARLHRYATEQGVAYFKPW